MTVSTLITGIGELVTCDANTGDGSAATKRNKASGELSNGVYTPRLRWWLVSILPCKA